MSEATIEKVSAGPVETCDELDEHLAAQLVEHARAQGTSLVGPDGLLGKLTKLVFETGLEAELDEHLGYGPHEAAGRNSGNSRNGTRPKTVTTEIGPIELDVPRQVDGRLIVRRVKRLNPTPGQDGLFEVWRHHAVFVTSGFETLQAESQHRGHAIVEQLIADAAGQRPGPPALRIVPGGCVNQNWPRSSSADSSHRRNARL